MLFFTSLSLSSTSQSSSLAVGFSRADRRAERLPRAMPEVVDTCSLASPASICRTKHLHLRCSVDFTRRVLTGTAALTVQSQEDNLRSLVRWDARPVPASPRPPASRPSPRCCPFPAPRSGLPRASLGAPPQPATHYSSPPFQPSLISQPSVPRPPLTVYHLLPIPLLSLHPSVTRYIYLSVSSCTPLPRRPPQSLAHPSTASTSCSHPAFRLHFSPNPPSPAILVPSAKPPVASPFPGPAAQNSLLRPQISSSPQRTFLRP